MSRFILMCALAGGLAVASSDLHGQVPATRSPSPTAMVFAGPPLARPVIVSGGDTAAFGDLFRASSVTDAMLADRPSVSVGLFWGTSSDPARNGTPIAELTLEMASQHGRYFFPHQGRPAVLLVTGFTKVLAPAPRPATMSAFTNGGPLAESVAPILQRLGLGPR